ncbi:hypothetical protein FRB94_001054, partial [Tulasnella sp. JGI-2019a]
PVKPIKKTSSPSPQTGSSTPGQGQSSGSNQPTGPPPPPPPQQPTAGSQQQQQPIQQQQPPVAPPPPPPGTGTGPAMSAGQSSKKAKWLEPDKFTGQVNTTGSPRSREFITSLTLYFIHYDDMYGKLTNRTAVEEQERVYFSLTLCTEMAFPWANLYTNEITSPTTVSWFVANNHSFQSFM